MSISNPRPLETLGNAAKLNERLELIERRLLRAGSANKETWNASSDAMNQPSKECCPDGLVQLLDLILRWLELNRSADHALQKTLGSKYGGDPNLKYLILIKKTTIIVFNSRLVSCTS